MVVQQENEEESPATRRGLVVGNYCHDVLIRDGHVIGESLGGATSFVSNVFDGLDLSSSSYISKVGPNFAYSLTHPPITISSSKTTLFHAHFSNQNQDRILRRISTCDPISPSDLPSGPKFSFGLAVGVAGEISPETLIRMLDLCHLIFVDAQSLIRTFDPVDGTVRLVSLRESGFYHLLPRIGFLKASAEEAPFVDVEEVRKLCCVVVTEGEEGCRVYWKDGELQIGPFRTVQIDPTGAGDSFLAGFVAGLVRGLAVPDAALLGNFFGSLTVGQIGVPKFNKRTLQKVREELERRAIQCNGCCERREIEADFKKPLEHGEFYLSLVEAAKLQTSEQIPNGYFDMQRSPQVTEQRDHQDNNGCQPKLLSSAYEVVQPGEDHNKSNPINQHDSLH
ncbi:pfkB-like carbohydrate kinase family protein [Tasmannia lanceolata]|uniref:pfkB-like carbohydrate kinase family protein n=1 Tax=Tasmannia lanceolata TaxID=3420 RepID=UPI0040628EEA